MNISNDGAPTDGAALSVNESPTSNTANNNTTTTSNINSLTCTNRDHRQQSNDTPTPQQIEGAPDIGDTYSHLPEHLKSLLPGVQRFDEGEESLKKSLLATLSPLGINRLVLDHGSRSNKDEETKSLFPHHRFSYICGSCSVEKRNQDSFGCCGFKVRLLLRKSSDGNPYLEVMEFCLPASSVHLLVSPEAREASASTVIKNEDKLTPNKKKTLMAMGKSRAKSHTVVQVMKDVHGGVTIDRQLMHRVMRKGRIEAWGADDNESMLIFYKNGISLLDVDTKYGVEGKFETTTCPETGTLTSWHEQLPIEVLNARVYGSLAYWVDTTHNATRFGLKTGPTSGCDWAGFVAPTGFFQVHEEEIESCGKHIKSLELDTPMATCCTDGGQAWPAIVKELNQNHVEDTFHNDKNADKKASGLSKQNRSTFRKMKYNALYSVFSPPEELDEHLKKMLDVTEENDECKNWVKRIAKGKEIRTATHTTKLHICSLKGATSRCESSMTKLKAGGHLKAEMRKWTIPEVQHRHRTIVENYLQDARKEMERAIKERRVFSNYVLELEKEELDHIHSLQVTATVENVPNPFHGMQQSSPNTIAIRGDRMNAEELGLTIEDKKDGDFYTFDVVKVSDGSVFKNTSLRAGMIIHTINGERWTTKEAGLNLIKSIKGRYCLLVDTVPSTGTVYTICRKVSVGGNKMERQVFIPNPIADDDTPHCQSNYHCHTSYFIRDRYIMRALLEHPTRSMKDDDTQHQRWHIKNSPLYPIVLRDLANMMVIPGLHNVSLPGFLSSQVSDATNAATAAAVATNNTNNTIAVAALSNSSNSIEVSNSEGVVIERPKKVTVPSSKAERYNDIHVKTRRIIEMAKHYPEVYREVSPQLDQIIQNCIFMMNCKSQKAAAAQKTLHDTQTQLPQMPAALCRDKSDDVNGANNGGGGNASKTGKRKRKRSRKQLEADGEDESSAPSTSNEVSSSLLKIGCAAGDLCGMPNDPFNKNYHFNCMNCELPMHGFKCGASWSEKQGMFDCTRVSTDRLSARGKELQSIGGTWICAQCIKRLTD